MRFELAGSLIRPDPLTVKFDVNGSFDTLAYIALGYTHFDIICIGGGGGRGGGIDTANTGTLIRSFGGAGGGGGYQRVRGLLSALPDTCPIVVGVAGTAGTEHASNPASTTDGGDGGFSTFNSTTCRASGGKGGKRVQSNSLTVTTQANGGDGGIGNRTIAGGGAAGGVAGTPSSTGPGTLGTAAADGTLFNDIGKGGGGGAGGVGKYGGAGTTCNAATNGGRGSYNPGDTSVYGPGTVPTADPSSGSLNVVPGIASGAKAAPLNGLPSVYGQSSAKGAVVIYLTALVIATKTSAPPVTPGISYGKVQKAFIFSKAVAGQSSVPPATVGYGAGAYGAGAYGNTTTIKFGAVVLPITFSKAVAGKLLLTQTTVAEISLASHVTPSLRTNHQLVIRARTLTGSGAVIKIALYEGSTNRSGDLISAALSNTLTDYAIAIPDASAAAITSYSNLTIKFWGYDVAGRALVFEVARVYLQLPSS